MRGARLTAWSDRGLFERLADPRTARDGGLEPPRPAPAVRARIVSALRRGELVYGTLHLIALAITLHRRDRVVVRRPRLEAPHLHAECRLRMALVQPDGVLRRLAELLGIRAVVHDAVVHVGAAGVVGRPPDDRHMRLRQFDLWPFGDLDARGFLGRRRYLSGGRVGAEEAT